MTSLSMAGAPQHRANLQRPGDEKCFRLFLFSPQSQNFKETSIKLNLLVTIYSNEYNFCKNYFRKISEQRTNNSNYQQAATAWPRESNDLISRVIPKLSYSKCPLFNNNKNVYCLKLNRKVWLIHKKYVNKNSPQEN